MGPLRGEKVMARNQAHVASIEALEDFRGKVAAFCELARNTAELALLEARKFENALADEQRYWVARLKRLENELALAKAELHRVRLATPRGETPRDGDVRLVIRRINDKIAHAEAALRELSALRSAAASCRESLRKELAQLIELVGKEPVPAVQRLTALLDRLTQYLAVAPPQTGATTQGVRHGAEEKGGGEGGESHGGA